MRRGLDWYKRDPIAFLDGVQGLGPDVIGAYAVIIDLLYARAGEMPRDDRHLSGILGCSMRLATSLTDRLIAAGKIEIHDGFIVNSRVETDAKPRRKLSETRANAGRKGGEKSGEVRKNKALAEANASSKHEAEKKREEKIREEPPTPPCDDAKQNPEPARKRALVDRASLEAEFAQIWPHYPRHVGKAAALKSWVKARRSTPYETIAGPLRRFVQVTRSTEVESIPHFSTWLNGKRWEDDQDHASNRKTPHSRNGASYAERFDAAIADLSARVADQPFPSGDQRGALDPGRSADDDPDAPRPPRDLLDTSR